MLNPVRLLQDKTFLRRFHASAVIVWLILIIPTLLWWKEAIVWVAIMSIWANVASHWAAWQASRAEQSNERQRSD